MHVAKSNGAISIKTRPEIPLAHRVPPKQAPDHVLALVFAKENVEFYFQWLQNLEHLTIPLRTRRFLVVPWTLAPIT